MPSCNISIEQVNDAIRYVVSYYQKHRAVETCMEILEHADMGNTTSHHELGNELGRLEDMGKTFDDNLTKKLTQLANCEK